MPYCFTVFLFMTTGRNGFIKNQPVTEQGTFENTESGRPKLIHNSATERLAARKRLIISVILFILYMYIIYLLFIRLQTPFRKKI